MSIVTKKGDRGNTTLYCGKIVPKDDIRVETCGDLDEVSSFLGMVKNISGDDKTKMIANFIQKELFVLGAEISAGSAGAARGLKKRICKASVCILEKDIEYLEKKRSIRIRSFCVPGANTSSSALDIARAITRRAERRCVTMVRKGVLKNRNILVYLNRLSDLLYLLARMHEKTN